MFNLQNVLQNVVIVTGLDRINVWVENDFVLGSTWFSWVHVVFWDQTSKEGARRGLFSPSPIFCFVGWTGFLLFSVSNPVYLIFRIHTVIL